MNKEQVAILKQFIQLYKSAADKEAFITMWETVLADADVDAPATLRDAYDAAYGDALISVYNEEGWLCG